MKGLVRDAADAVRDAAREIAGYPSLDTRADDYFAAKEVWTRAMPPSSNVHSFAYFIDLDTGRNVLSVRFRPASADRTRTYRYYDVPLRVFMNMQAASSRGKFVWTDLRDRYEYREVL